MRLLASQLTIVFLLLSFFSMGQQVGLLKGRVVEKGTDQPLVGANIYVKENLTIGAVTDFNGFFTIALQPGKYLFTVSFTGMKSTSFSLDVKDGSTIERHIEMEAFSTQFEEVVVRAGKFERKLEEQTVSIEVIKPRLIQAKNTRSVETILDMTPGLTILDDEPQIRGGSGFTFGVGSKVAVLVDDMPMISGDAGKPDWSFIPVENIKQIEVVKGASSVLSGSSALSGAIYVRTNYPSIQPETKVNIYSGFYTPPKAPANKWWSGTNYLAGGSFLHSRQLGKGKTDFVIGGLVAMDKSYIGAPKPGPYVADTNNIQDSDMGNKKFRFNFNLRQRSEKIKGLDYGLNGNFMYKKESTAFAWLDDTAGFYRGYPGAVLLENTFSFYLDPFVNFYTRGGIKHQFSGRILHRNMDANNDQSSKAWMYYSKYQFQKRFVNLGNLDFIGGVANHYTKSNANMYAASGSAINDLWNLSIYMEVEKKLGNVLNVSAGVRVENFRLNDSITDTKPIFRLGTSLKLAKETYLRASLGQGYRFPTITERYIKTSVGSFGVFDNPDLIPETSWNAEVGIKQGFKFSEFYGFFDVAGFYQEYDNTIEYLFGFWDSTYTFALAGFKFVNTGKSRITGVDISMTGQAKFSKHYEINTLFGYTYIVPITLQPDLVFAKDYKQGDASEFSYNSTSVDPSKGILKYRFLHTIKMDLEFVFKSFSYGISARYFSKIENLDKAIFDFEDATVSTGGTLQPILYRDYYENHNNGNLVVDMRISYAINLKHKVALISDNIFNRRYSLRPLKAEPMRTVMLQYSLNL